MSNPIREHLIGYVLGAIEPEERAIVDEQLKHDDASRRELELMRTSLHPLACDAGHHVPPSGLAQRCCHYVFSRAELMPAALSPAATVEYGGRRRWSWLDLSVGGAIAAAVAFLLVPAVYQSHLYSQRIQCQDNLQHVGAALANYSDRNGGYYPAISPKQPLSVPTLVRQGYLPGTAVVCPSTHQPDEHAMEELLPEQLQKLRKDQFEQFISRLNSYGYTLGFTDGNKLMLQRNEHRKEFPLSSDLPGKGPANSPNHGGDGQNVLFEDGHVEYLKSPKVESTGDDIFRNAKGEVAPGVDRNDSVIVPRKKNRLDRRRNKRPSSRSWPACSSRFYIWADLRLLRVGL